MSGYRLNNDKGAYDKARNGAVLSRLSTTFWLPIAWIAAVVLLALAADVLPLVEYDYLNFKQLSSPPGASAILPGGNFYTYWLGTDTMGRDIGVRLMYGARISLIVGLASPLIGLLAGGTLGILAGYYQGKTALFIDIFTDTLLAFPGLVLLLAITFYLGSSLPHIVFGLGILTIPVFCRVARANTIKYAERDFIHAARMIGRSDAAIIFFEILPNVVWPLIVYSLVVASYMIVAEGALSFLGLSLPPPFPSWGGMIAEGREVLGEACHVSLIPALCMSVTVLSFNLIGDSLRSALEEKGGNR